MTFKEFRALLGCALPLIAAAARGDTDAMYRIQAKVNGIHAQIDARKAAR